MTARTASNGIRYRLEGPERAPVLVLAHALGTSHALWDVQLPRLVGQFRVLRYDMRGHGGSALTAGPYDIELLSRDVLALLDELALPVASFCGLSLGGMVGIWLGAHAAGRLERLVLANTSAHLGGAAAWDARIELVQRAGMAALTESVLERWFTPGFRAASPAAVERIRQLLNASPASGYAACCAAVRDMDQRESLGSIRTPTLVICGRHDAGTTPAHARLIAERIPGARLTELEAAHLSNIEAAEDFTRTLLGFLASPA